MGGSGRPSEMVKPMKIPHEPRIRQRKTLQIYTPNFEPLVGLLVDNVVFIAELLRRDALFQGLRLCRSPILVRSANIESSEVTCSYDEKHTSSALVRLRSREIEVSRQYLVTSVSLVASEVMDS